MRDQGFTFTITDAARFLGKSPVTLRKWEQRGIYEAPRVGGDRRLGIKDLRDLSNTAFSLGRINKERLDIVLAACTLLEVIENGNRRSR